MNSQPLVTGIIIFFNSAPFLQEAIGSVFSQSYQNWELLLCDDGSTDGSTEIARQWIRRFPDKVRYFEHEGHQNRGMSATRNLGLKHAKGEYIAWLDGDDVWLPQKLERQVQLMQAHTDAGMVYGPLGVWFSWTGKRSDYRRDFTQDIGVSPDTLIEPPRLLNHFLQNDMYIPSGVLVRRKVLEEVGGYEESFKDQYEDVMVHAKVCLKWPVFASGESWYKYRQHEGSACAEARNAGRETADRGVFLNRLAEYLHEQGCDNGQLRQVVQAQLGHITVEAGKSLSNPIGKSRTMLQLGYRRGIRLAKTLSDRLLPQTLRKGAGWRGFGDSHHLPTGWIHFGNLRRVAPVSRVFGLDRGTPIDRYYIEEFLQAHSSDIRGHVMEVGDPNYTRKFGGDRVTRSAVLSAASSAYRATLVGDLCTGEGVPRDAFDCMILTQVFHVLYDIKAAVGNAVRALRPEGVMLVTLPGISQISRYDADRWGDFWRFTSQSARLLFEDHFAPENLEIDVYGNVLAAVAFLYGLAAQELQTAEMDYQDPDYEMIIAVRAVKSRCGEQSIS